MQALVLVLLAVGAAVASYELHPRAPSLYLIQEPLRDDEVGLKEIQERWQGQVIWLDARPEDVFKTGHIPEAHMLNEQGFFEQLLELQPLLQTTDKPVIIYCGGEKCEASRLIRGKLLDIVPLENCFILKGGWPAWQAAQK